MPNTRGFRGVHRDVGVLFGLPVLYGHGIGLAGVFALQCAAKLIIGKADPSVAGGTALGLDARDESLSHLPLLFGGILRR